jgi:hypothetical protein
MPAEAGRSTRAREAAPQIDKRLNAHSYRFSRGGGSTAGAGASAVTGRVPEQPLDGVLSLPFLAFGAP